MWKPRISDPDRVNRGALVFGLAGFAIAMSFMIALPWLPANAAIHLDPRLEALGWTDVRLSKEPAFE